MKIQRPKRITTENIVGDEAKEAVDSIAYSMNTFIEEVYLAIMGSTNITDNLDQTYKVLKLSVDSNGIPINDIQFNVSLKSRVNGILCVRALQATVVSQPFVSFTESSGLVKITHITGLTADTEYQLVLLVLGT